MEARTRPLLDVCEPRIVSPARELADVKELDLSLDGIVI
jgi:hypothetical protein